MLSYEKLFQEKSNRNVLTALVKRIKVQIIKDLPENESFYLLSREPFRSM